MKNLKLTLIFSFSFLLTVGQVRWNPELKTALLIDTISNLKAQQPEEQLKDIKTWIISKEGRNVKMEGSNIITAGFSLPLKDYEKTGTKYSNRFVDFNFRAELIENEIVFKVTDFSYREKLIYKIGSESVEFERDKFYEKQSKGKKKSRTWFKDEIDEELRKFLEELRQEMK